MTKTNCIAIYHGATDEHVQRGACDDPRGLLTIGEPYETLNVNIEHLYTTLELVEFPGKQFNIASFSAPYTHELPGDIMVTSNLILDDLPEVKFIRKGLYIVYEENYESVLGTLEKSHRHNEFVYIPANGIEDMTCGEAYSIYSALDRINGATS